TNISTLGIMALLGYSLNILTVLIPTIISFVAISDVIHFYSKFRICIEDGMEKSGALIKTVKEIGLATFLTSVTTAIGFISLLSIKVAPVKLLGVFTALGVLLAFIFTFILLPYFSDALVHQKAGSTKKWQSLAMRCFNISRQYPRAIILAATLLILAGVYGLYQVRIDAYLLDDLPKDSPSREAFAYVDDQYGGTKPWNLYGVTKDSSSIITPENLQEMKLIQDYLTESYGLHQINSPVTAMKVLNVSFRGGNRKYYEMPSDSSTLSELIRYNKKLLARNIIIQQDSGQAFASISGFIPEWGSLRTMEKDQDLEEYLKEHTSGAIKYHITGTTALIDKSHEYLSENLFMGLLFAFCAVAVISVLLFRSVTMLLITLLPNVVPVLLTAAVIGFFNIPIKLTTSIIFAISFGIAVDDTIHFISRFRLEMQRHDTETAVKNTFRTAGMALIQTTFLLTIGFGVFCFSSFGATFYTGLFIVLTLLFALLTDLFLLPVLLLKFFRQSNET
ncbi:MAG: MMPL family transporter, partial [Bacteroidota bacterium]